MERAENKADEKKKKINRAISYVIVVASLITLIFCGYQIIEYITLINQRSTLTKNLESLKQDSNYLRDNFDVLKNELSNKNNIEFMLVENKNHNPNYTVEAVKYKDEFFKTYKKYLKKKLLKKVEDKEKFKNSFNWFKMTQQDFNIWKEVFRVLDNE